MTNKRLYTGSTSKSQKELETGISFAAQSPRSDKQIPTPKNRAFRHLELEGVYHHYLVQIIASIGLAALISCGGSGGGSNDERSPGSVGIDASPQTVDTGDRIAVTIFLENIHPDGVILKVRIPEQFGLAIGSTRLTIGEDKYNEVTPLESGKGRNSDDSNLRYIVYSLPSTLFSSENRGSLIFLARADAAIKNGRIEIDLDTNDNAIPDRNEFSLTSPHFTALDSIEVSAKE